MGRFKSMTTKGTKVHEGISGAADGGERGIGRSRCGLAGGRDCDRGEYELMVDAQVNAGELMLRSMRGAGVRDLQQVAEAVWQFDFERAGLTIECRWRIVSGGSVVLASSDHGQKFSLPAPVDLILATLEKLKGLTVEAIDIHSETADLRLAFGGGTRIDTFNDSSGYEGWNYSDRTGVMLVAQGGGQLAIWSNLPKRK